MRPDQPLTIFEIRAADEAALDIFDDPGRLRRLGPNLAGLHWEAGFAFVFFTGDPGPGPAGFLAECPNLETRHIHHLTYAQWQDGAGAAPFTVAGLTVTGPEGGGEEPKIIIDPGLAFGFGGHPTTHSCLTFLGRAVRGNSPPASALDLGAGTGILALAAARWGLPEVVGVDYSHLAIEAARNNLALNNLADQVSFYRAPAQKFCRHAGELLLANLHLSLQEELLELGAFDQRRQVIVSGLLPGEGERLWARLTALGFTLVDQIRTDRWVTIYGERRD
jgi:ribosomal protein L11 methyltransferase